MVLTSGLSDRKDPRSNGGFMVLMGVDLGYNEQTTVAIVRVSDANGRFIFESINRGIEFDEVVQRVIVMMRKYGVSPNNVSAPRHPAFEKKIQDFFKKHPPT